MEDITKRIRDKKNNAKRVIRNTIQSSVDQEFLLKVIDTAFADIVRGSTVLLTQKNDNVEVINKVSVSAMSDSLTDILNNFYQIENYLNYRKDLDSNRVSSQRRTNAELTQESFTGQDQVPNLVPQRSGGNSELGDILELHLPQLTAKFNELAEALDNFSIGGAQGPDIDIGGKPGKPGGRPGARPRLPAKTSRGPIPKSPFTLGGVVGALGMGYLAVRALTGGFGRGGTEPGVDGITAGGGTLDGEPSYTVGPGQYQQADTSKVSGDWKNDKPFLAAVDGLARKWNVDANDLLGIMYSESGVNPARVNSIGAAGLIQWIPKYAKSITGYSTDQIRKLSRTQQVALIDKTLTAAGMPKGANAGQIYAAIFLPSIARNKGWKGVLTRKSDPDQFYEQNRGLDVISPFDEISIEDLAVRVNEKRQAAGLPAMGNLSRGGEISPGLAGSGGLSKPLPQGVGVTVQGGKFGANRGYGAHKGLDFAAPAGTPVLAAQAGKVTRAGMSNARGGIRVEVLHDAASGLSTKYMHLDPRVPVKEGQMVSQGQVIGYIGRTGLKTTGSGSGDHVHVEVLVNGKNVDPTPYFKGAGATGAKVDNASKNRPRITPQSSQKYIQAQQQLQRGQWPGAPYALPKTGAAGPFPAKPNLNPSQQYRKYFGT